MKKRWLAILIAIATCLAVLSGCSFVKVFEKDVQVVLRNGEEYVGTYTVNIFNNAVVPEPTKAGYKFAGWVAQRGLDGRYGQRRPAFGKYGTHPL